MNVVSYHRPAGSRTLSQHIVANPSPSAMNGAASVRAARDGQHPDPRYLEQPPLTRLISVGVRVSPAPLNAAVSGACRAVARTDRDDPQYRRLCSRDLAAHAGVSSPAPIRAASLDQVLALTHGDRYKALPGYQVMNHHYHMDLDSGCWPPAASTPRFPICRRSNRSASPSSARSIRSGPKAARRADPAERWR